MQFLKNRPLIKDSLLKKEEYLKGVREMFSEDNEFIVVRDENKYSGTCKDFTNHERFRKSSILTKPLIDLN